MNVDSASGGMGEATLSREVAEELADRYDDERRGKLYAWFDVEDGHAELVETQWAENGLMGPDADIHICINSQSVEEVVQAFNEERDRRAKIQRLEERV